MQANTMVVRQAAAAAVLCDVTSLTQWRQFRKFDVDYFPENFVKSENSISLIIKWMQ